MKRVVFGVVVVAACVAVIYASIASYREQSYRQLIDRGEAALARDDTFAALEAFTGAIAVKPDSMLGHLKRGETYRRRTQLEEAMPDLLRASALDPLAPRPLELLGDVNYSLARFGRAVERYGAYIKLDDRSPRVLYKLALSHYSAGQPRPAIEALRQAITIDDAFAEAHYLLGLSYGDLERSSESRRALERSVRLAPAMLQARDELADLYGRLGRADDRLAQLAAVLALDPGPSREVTLGVAYGQAGQFDRAVATLRTAAQRYPEYPYTYVALGRLWLDVAQNRRDRVSLSKAIRALNSAVALDESSEALVLAGRAHLLAQNTETAERLLQQATRKMPADPLAFYYLAEAAERRGHRDVARRALLDYRALDGDGDSAGARRSAALAVRIADLSMRLGDAAAAATWYARGIGNPADVAVLVRFAVAQASAGHVEAARATLGRVLDQQPNNRLARAALRRLK